MSTEAHQTAGERADAPESPKPTPHTTPAAAGAVERLVAAFRQAGIGGNSLASAVISAGLIDVKRDTDFEAVWQSCGNLPPWDAEKQRYIAYEMWLCWNAMMNARDSVDDLLHSDEAALTPAPADHAAGDAGALRVALEAARHSLTTLHGLTATDGLSKYTDELDYDGDHVFAWKRFVEYTWTIDESKVLAQIDEALAATPERADQAGEEG